MPTMNDNAITRINRLLGMKFWFGGKFILNKGQDTAVIVLDGCLSYKFKVHKNDKLRVIQIGRYLALGLKPLQTVTFDQLYDRIAGIDNKLAGSYMQLTSPMPIPINIMELRELEMARNHVLSKKYE